MSIYLLALLGFGAAYLFSRKNAEEYENKLNDFKNDVYKDVQSQIDESTITRKDVIDGVSVEAAMIGVSSISDKYWNCAAGILWRNDTNEDVNVKLDSGTFTIGGYEMVVGATSLSTITIPAKSTLYQDIFKYRDHTLFNQAARKQVRMFIGEAQGHKGQEARAVWGNAEIDCVFRATFSIVSDISKISAGQDIEELITARCRYFGSTALPAELAKYVRNHIS